MIKIRRHLLSIQFISNTFDIISEDEYTGKFFYCTCKYNNQQVFGIWSISQGNEYASINENGKVTINEGVENQDIEITCTYGEDIASKVITISYDNQLTIECADTLTGTSGNAIARYNSTVVSDATWSITSGGTYATINSTGEITILGTGSITIQAEYNDYTATKTINVVYDASKSSSTEVNEDGSVTTTETTTTTDPETGAVTEASTSTTVNEDGSTSSTTETTTTNTDGSSETTSTTTNQDGTSSETQSTTSAPDQETGAVTTESNTTHYDENGDVSGSSDSTVVENTDGSSTSQVNNYNAEGDPTSTTNNEVDTSGNSSTQQIEYDSTGNPVVTEYTIDTSGSSGEGKEIQGGVNTDYYAFDATRGFILDIDFIINFKNQPAGQDQNHHNILTAKRADPEPWYGFQLRHSQTNSYIQLGTQFATGSNTNTRIDPTNMVNNVAEYILRIVYDPTVASNNFICTNMRTGNVVFTASNTFPDIEALRNLKVTLGYAVDPNGDPYRYSDITVVNFAITKMSAVLAPTISCTGRQVTITANETGATNYYRLNQTGNFVEYTNSIIITDDTFVEAYSELNGLRSNTVSQNCIFTGLKKPTIIFKQNTITVSCDTPNATIYYRLNQIGEYIIYNAPIEILEDTVIQTYSELGGDTSEIVYRNCIYDPSHDYSLDYLTFKVITAGTICWGAYGSGVTQTIEYSKNEGEWTSITAGTAPATISVNAHDEIRFRGSNNYYATTKANYNAFSGGTATFNVEGNIMSLIYGDNFASEKTFPSGSKYNFCSLFKQTNVVSAENLILPVKTLTEGCYRALFSKSATLTYPPALPATTLATDCYWYMFEECPIVTTPDLEATTLTKECYGWMFLGCGSVNYIRCLATDGFSSSSCLASWTKGVSSVGTFVKAKNATWPTGINGIPTGWTVYNDGEEPEPPEPDGSWRYANQKIELPYSINAIDGHSSSYAKGSYTFTCSIEIEALQPTYLWFDHADQSAEIYINNVLVTTHWGGYNSFTVDITNYIQLGSNEIKVILNNTTRNTLAPAAGDFNFNATLGNVEVITGPILPAIEYGYDGFRITTANVSAASADITVTTSIPTSGTVVLTIDDGTYHYTDTQTGSGVITFNTTITNPHLWNGKSDPHLYNVTIEIYDGENLSFTATRPYGIRYFSYVYNDSTVIQNEYYTGFLLNGAPYYLRGVCMHQDLEYKANALTEEDIEHDFDIINELGCNFIRTAHYPHPRKFYDMCDELGIVVQTEIPWVNKAQSTMSEDYYTHLGSQALDMILQHYNHPSIMFWGLANEITTDDKDFAKGKIENLTAIIRNYDTSRMIGYVVSHSYPNGLGTFNGPNVDYIGQNLYVGWYIDQNSNDPTNRINTFLNNANGYHKPAALSEYGCGGTQSCHSDTPLTTTTRGNNPRHDIEYQMWLHEGHIAAIKNSPQLLYTAQWVLFDFAVVSRQEGYTVCLDGETTSTNEELKRLNDKGLVERDHTTKKDTFYLYKAWWNPTDKFVHICGKDYTKKVDRTIKCYTNDGNSLELYVNDTLVETSGVTDNIAVFTSRTYTAGDVIRVKGANTNDTHTF